MQKWSGREEMVYSMLISIVRFLELTIEEETVKKI